MTCRDCGSPNSVPKADAWDALAQVPPKTAKRLERLERIADAARALAVNSPAEPSEKMAVVTVPAALLDDLRDSFKEG